MMSNSELLKVDGITKAFPGVLANDAITFDLKAGEIHALLGENGAGKTTLVSMLYGLQRPDSGRILINGAELELGDPRQAIVHGLGFVQQHYSLVPSLTVIENLVLSSHYGSGQTLSRERIERRVAQLSQRHGLALDTTARVERLSVSEQQHVELIKTLIASPRVLILDEPAALLSAEEVKKLWQVLRDLATQGVGIILIGHKLEDVLAIADRITVLRRGRVVATVSAKEVNATQLGAMMVGTLAADGPRLPAPALGSLVATALEVRHLSVNGDRAPDLLKDIDFSVRSGEILGIAGVIGSGQPELLEVIMGIRAPSAGEVILHGHNISTLKIRERHALGLAFIPGDRHRDGLIGPMSLADNLALGVGGEPTSSRVGVLRLRSVYARARELMKRFGINAASPSAPAATLSGGNQQKLIFARELGRNPKVVLCCYPTRGLDFAATAAVHQELRLAAARGAAVVVVSIDLDEILALASRLIVIQGGRITGEVAANEVTAAEIGVMLGGGIAA
jgi:general nucleoside transport system ATP-binding protein